MDCPLRQLLLTPGAHYNHHRERRLAEHVHHDVHASSGGLSLRLWMTLCAVARTWSGSRGPRRSARSRADSATMFNSPWVGPGSGRRGARRRTEDELVRERHDVEVDGAQEHDEDDGARRTARQAQTRDRPTPRLRPPQPTPPLDQWPGPYRKGGEWCMGGPSGRAGGNGPPNNPSPP